MVKSFYGLSYTSLGVQVRSSPFSVDRFGNQKVDKSRAYEKVVPGCSATQANVTEDIQLMSQLTSARDSDFDGELRILSLIYFA